MIYLDSSALLKLVRAEAHTADLREWLGDRSDVLLVSSALAQVEVLRSCRRIDEQLLRTGRAVIAALHLIPLDGGVLDAAAELPGTDLRSLDALHLTSALQLGTDLVAFVAYDTRLVNAARAQGLPMAQPGV
ncbi:type II toxin-antitoxin system VapC family toxin [Blastococcus sp. CT_GayMR16]|uniref:type II toxin-antitoxin system VapC family toxin n=1 Tax=Blastococcus sp. CT_GayMR16 TaxID=2559607 RepID=UPI0010732B19|nr:type II toxin-antitoxin system VapC family toxin [Blastococcus sp. CT_GayMR16]TFV86261.1 PIN domain-containing protein [Blastococcus sp. CT_GayMR16]